MVLFFLSGGQSVHFNTIRALQDCTICPEGSISIKARARQQIMVVLIASLWFLCPIHHNFRFERHSSRAYCRVPASRIQFTLIGRSEKVADAPLWWVASISPCSWIAEWLEDTRNSRGMLSWLPPALSLFIFTPARWKKENWWVAKAIGHLIQAKRLSSLWQSIPAPATAFSVGAADVKKEEKTGTVNDRWRMTSYHSMPSFQRASFGSTAVLAQLTTKLMRFCLWLEANPNYCLLWPEPHRICHRQLSRFPQN